MDDKDFEFIDDSPIVEVGMTQYEIADALGISQTLVRRIERQALEKIRKKLIFHPRYEEIIENPHAGKNWLPRLF